MGPKEESSWWWAQCRIAFSIFACKVWSRGREATWYCYISRVMDKSGWFPVTMFKDIASRIDWSGISTCTLWADTGTHFRCRQVLQFFAQGLLEQVRSLSRTSVEFLCEHHGKGECDGFFGVLSQARADAVLRENLMEVSDVIRVYEKAAQRRREVDPTAPREIYIEWWPPDKSSFSTTLIFKLSSLPAPLTSTYSWSFTCNDWRRDSLLGRGFRRNTLTGVTARCHLVTGESGTELRTFHPELELATKLLEGEGEDHEAEVEPEEVTHRTRVWRGWRCSYRTKEPERETPEKVAVLLRRKATALEPFTAKTAASSRHRSHEDIRQSMRESFERKAVRGVAERLHFASKRV